MVSRLGTFVPRPPITVTPEPLRPPPTTPQAPVTPVVVAPTDPKPPVRPPLVPKPLPPPTPDISLPKGLRRPPTANDLVIKRTFDGLTPQQAQDKISGALTTTVAPQNRALVDRTIAQRVRDMQTALNNVFTPGTPNNQFLASQLPAKINVLGSLSASNAIVYQVTKEGQPPKYYARGWGTGGFTELKQPPAQVVMNGELTLDPRGLRMKYPAWENKALAGTISEMTEL